MTHQTSAEVHSTGIIFIHRTHIYTFVFRIWAFLFFLVTQLPFFGFRRPVRP